MGLRAGKEVFGAPDIVTLERGEMRGQREVRHWVAVCQQSTQAVEGARTAPAWEASRVWHQDADSQKSLAFCFTYKCPMSEADRLLLMRGLNFLHLFSFARMFLSTIVCL